MYEKCMRERITTSDSYLNLSSRLTSSRLAVIDSTTIYMKLGSCLFDFSWKKLRTGGAIVTFPSIIIMNE
jgi:uncharacterized glyoxalase superfamily protein PhnB